MPKSNNWEHFLESLDIETQKGFVDERIAYVTVDVQDSNGKSVRKQKFDNYKDVSDYVYDKMEPGYNIVLTVN